MTDDLSSVKRLAVLPARGGSKRIPRKNIRDFCGRPMMTHILGTAQQSGLFDTIHVSTDDDEIAAVATQFDAAPQFPRAPGLADDATPIMAVVKSVTETLIASGNAYDEVWLLMACAPLITVADLLDAARVSAQHAHRRPILAVTEYPVPVEWAMSLSEDGSLNPLAPGNFEKNSQEFAPKFHDTGTFAVYPTQRVLDAVGAGLQYDFVAYHLPRTRGIDIDNESDWAFAETLHKLQQTT